MTTTTAARPRVTRRLPLALLAFTWPAAVGAQTVDPIFADLEDADAEASAWQWFGDASASGDRVTGLPDRRVERLRARLRIGLRGNRGDIEYAVSAKAAIGSDDNADNRRNNDNERSDAATLDEAWLRWLAGERTTLQIGQGELPLVLTPLTWDSDLRPIGASIEQRWAVGDIDELRLVAGHFAGNHLYGDESRLSALQLGWQWRPGAPFSADIQLGYLHFDDLREATREGLTRTNRRIGDRLLSDYRLLDLQFGLRWELPRGPLALRIDLLQNLGADDQDRGGRLSLVHGHADRLTGLELGVSWQRIGRDAAMAAFNSDDWWFHSAARGVMPWVAWGMRSGWTVQASFFHERLDGRDEYVDRALVELRRSF